jgi:hypothetical protein
MTRISRFLEMAQMASRAESALKFFDPDWSFVAETVHGDEDFSKKI